MSSSTNKLLSSTDKPTGFAHPGWRAAYTVVSVGILGITLSEGNSLFVGIMILSWGLLFDYFKFNPITKFRLWTKRIGCFWSSILIIFNLFFSLGAMEVVKGVNGGLYSKIKSFPFFTGQMFEVKWYWLIISLVTIILTLVDWLSEVREFEEEMNKGPEPTAPGVPT